MGRLVQPERLNGRAGRGVELALGKDQQRIGQYHGHQDAGALGAGEPCLGAVGVSLRVTRRKCCSLGLTVTASPRRTGTERRNGSSWPAIRRIAGRTNSSKVTIVLTGFPGSPIHGTDPRIPNPTGAPGRILSLQNRCSAPSSFNTSRR